MSWQSELDIEEFTARWDQNRTENWDSYGALPVRLATIINAWAFLRLLPDDVSEPFLCAEPIGQITFDWHENEKILSVSIGPLGELSYGFSSNGPNGVEIFDGTIPDVILDLIRKVCEK